jgi:hypothetical protein
VLFLSMRYTIILLLVFCFASCEVKVKTAQDTEPGKDSYTRNNNKIRNGIEVKTSGGVEVKQAFLSYADDGSLVDDKNITALKRKIKLNLILDGWKEENGRVELEASEKVTTNEGDVVLEVNNLFQQSGLESLSPADAKEVTLSVVIDVVHKLSDYFLVEFSVWNEKADQSVKGHYKFYINNM